METVVILLLTVAVAASVVWWVSTGELPFSFRSARREDDGEGDSAVATESEGLGGASGFGPADTRWPRTHPAPARGMRKETARVVGHRSTRGQFAFGTAVEDRRPPVVLTILRLVLTVALVGGLIAGSIWMLGQFAASFMARLIGE